MQRQDGPVQSNMNGTSGMMNHRPAVSNDPMPVNGNGPAALDRDRRSLSSTGRATSNTSASAQDRGLSLQVRPTSAPGGTAESSQDESEIDRSKQKPTALLQRSKSDFGPRGEDLDSQEDEIQDWGARHGFEDHYASEEYVSQLANVGRTFLSVFKLCCQAIRDRAQGV